MFSLIDKSAILFSKLNFILKCFELDTLKNSFSDNVTLSIVQSLSFINTQVKQFKIK